jgi:hypothetical protein
MKIAQHGLREHIRLLSPAFVLVAGVWILRMIMSASGIPLWMTRIASVSVATTVSVLLAAILIYARRFGSYTSVVVASFLLNLWGQCLVVSAVLFSMITQIENIYTIPEFSVGTHGWIHIYWHLTFGLAIGTLVGAAVGCLLLAMLRIFVGK